MFKRYALGSVALAALCALLVSVPAGSAAHRGGGTAAPRAVAAPSLVPQGPATKAAQFSGNVVYHGGPLMKTTTVYAIFWVPSGFTMGTTYRNLIVKYFQDVAGASGQTTNVYAPIPEYSVPGYGLQIKTTYGGSTVATQALPKTAACASNYPSSGASLSGCITDTDAVNEIKAVMTAKGWSGGLGKMFFLFTPENVGSCFDSSSSCAIQDYCGYHSSFTRNNQKVIWANHPFPSLSYYPQSYCDAGSHPNGNIADATLSVVSHEHKEAITDPLVNSNTSTDWGWFENSPPYDEISDKCAWTFGATLGDTGANDPSYAADGHYNQIIGSGKYFLQREWSNSRGGCVTHAVGPAIAVSSVSPASGPVGSTFTISGNGFLDATGAKLNGATLSLGAPGYNVTSQTKISVKVPAGSTTGLVKVNNVGSVQFKVTPKITSLSTSSAREGDTVLINGTTFNGATLVKFGSLSDPGFTVNGANTQITAHVPVGATSGPVSVTTPNGTTTATFGVRPTVSSFTPATGILGAQITLTGKTMANVTKVTFGTATGTATIKSKTATSVTVAVPSTAISGPITVTNAGGSTASVSSFSVLPKLLSISPTAAVAGQAIAINGTGLSNTNSVKFNGTPAVIFGKFATKAIVVVPTTATMGPIELITDEGTPTQLATIFKPLPKLAAHASVQAGDTVTLSGSNLTGGTLTFGGAALGTTGATATSMTTDPLPATAVSCTLKVTTSTGSYSITLGVKATISGLSVSSGKAGDHVTINGNTLSPVTVKFAGGLFGVPAVIFGRGSRTAVTVTVPTGAVTGPITVTNSGGSTASASFTVLPKITSVSPNSGLAGATIQIKGSGLNSTLGVTFHGTAATNITQVSSTQVNAKVPAGATDGVIHVQTSAGGADSPSPFNVLP